MLATIRRLAGPTGILLLILGMASLAAAAGPPPAEAPEIDPGSMVSALTLLSGGMLILTGRRRK